MKGIQVRKGTHWLVCFSLILALAIMLNAGYTNAQEIGPDQSFNMVTLLKGQSTGSLGVSQSIPFGFNTLGVVSVGNRSLTASLNITSREATGFWVMYVIATGPASRQPFSFGLIPWNGPSVSVNLVDPYKKRTSYALVMTTMFLTSSVSADEPFRYSVSVTATAP